MATENASSLPSDLFASLPSIFVSRTHFADDELNAFEDILDRAGARLTYDILECGIILSKVTKRTRLLFDLRTKGITIEEAVAVHDDPLPASSPPPLPSSSSISTGRHHQKQHEVIEIEDDDSNTASQAGTEPRSEPEPPSSPPGGLASGKSPSLERDLPSHSPEQVQQGALPSGDVVHVVHTGWVHDSIRTNQVLAFGDFETISGYRQQIASDQHDAGAGKLHKTPTQSDPSRLKSPEEAILQRAKEDLDVRSAHPVRSLKRKFQGSTASLPRSRDAPSWAPGYAGVKHAHLLHATTSEEDQGFGSDLPEPPDWVSKGIKYACQRSTLMGSPNEKFVELLRKIKLARLLTSDEIGVRAYSTSIAALLAYSHKFASPKEILRLPGCDAKIANLFVEYANTGVIKAVQDIEADHDLTILRLFYNIWGVGGLTAREFYFDRGWQDLDDLVEYNWKGLSRVQQIGVKYYDEFLDPIPRAEVESIGRVIQEHAIKVRDPDVQSIIVGGYRRGKTASGDVDIIISHPDEKQTLDIIIDIVASLEEEGWITHTLLLSTNNTKRDQQTLPFRSGDMHGGHGFDSLDKALVVWQNPEWDTKKSDIAADPKAKNPNIHRRVDIIIAPWRTVGCAVLGWSGGTTFQRDIRRYVKHLFGWKFDSSGVRDRGNGEALDLEGYHRYDGKLGEGRAKTMLEAEKRVFEGLKLEYREAWERCTD